MGKEKPYRCGEAAEPKVWGVYYADPTVAAAEKNACSMGGERESDSGKESLILAEPDGNKRRPLHLEEIGIFTYLALFSRLNFRNWATVALSFLFDN